MRKYHTRSEDIISEAKRLDTSKPTERAKFRQLEEEAINKGDMITYRQLMNISMEKLLLLSEKKEDNILSIAKKLSLRNEDDRKKLYELQDEALKKDNYKLYGELMNLTTEKTINYVDTPLQTDCNFTLELSSKLLRYIHQYIFKDVEYSGILHIVKYQGNKAILGVIPREISRGELTKAHIPECSPFNFHTHPKLGYIENLLFIAWPSGPDMAFVIQERYRCGNYMHFLFTIEGIYTITMTPEFSNYFDTLTDTIKLSVRKAVEYKFSNYEKYCGLDMHNKERCERYKKSKREEDLFIERDQWVKAKNFFIDIVQSFTISGLNEYMDDKNILSRGKGHVLLFDVRHYDWDFTLSTTMHISIFLPKGNAFCPPKIGRNVDGIIY